MLMVGFRSCVDYEVKCWQGFESGRYIRVKMMTIFKIRVKMMITLRLGLR
jgi:hypothetical protein